MESIPKIEVQQNGQVGLGQDIHNDTEATEDVEKTVEKDRDKELRLGAKVLAMANFHKKNEEIVESSFHKEINSGESLPGKNAERRTYAYLDRMQKLIDKYGNSIEKNAWAESIKDDLIIKWENVPESYWQSKRQECRDNGNELTEQWKKFLFKREQRRQKESLERWANYLGDEKSTYPLWFKVYAWDGMTKMGVYNKQKQRYEKRNETTVAPYPEPDAEILSKVFDVVNRYYGNNESEFYTKEGERNIELEKIIQSGSFSRIYTAIQQDVSPILQPPKDAKDVKGEWREYGVGEESDIARAALGTGWCVASSAVAKCYLAFGKNNNDGRHAIPDRTKSKFILFHLENPENHALCKNACASIRLDTSGKVAEISGIETGQAITESLIDEVEKKVRDLPGGEEFLGKFADKKELILLDKKMKNGEDLTKEELEFLYETNRKIRTLDTYNTEDPRIGELKKKYDIRYAIEAGLDSEQLIKDATPLDIMRNIDYFEKMGTNIKEVVSELSPKEIIQNVDAIKKHNIEIDIEQTLSSIPRKQLGELLETIIENGIDVSQVLPRLSPSTIVSKFDYLAMHGIQIDIDKVVSEMNPSLLVKYYDTLEKHGAKINIDEQISQLDSNDFISLFGTLTKHKRISIDEIERQMRHADVRTVCEHLEELDGYVNTGKYIKGLPKQYFVKNLTQIMDHITRNNANAIAEKLRISEIDGYEDKLKEYGIG